MNIGGLEGEGDVDDDDVLKEADMEVEAKAWKQTNIGGLKGEGDAWNACR